MFNRDLQPCGPKLPRGAKNTRAHGRAQPKKHLTRRSCRNVRAKSGYDGAPQRLFSTQRFGLMRISLMTTVRALRKFGLFVRIMPLVLIAGLGSVGVRGQ